MTFVFFRNFSARDHCPLICAIGLALVFPAVLRADLLSSDALGELKTRLVKGAALEEVPAVIAGIESEARSGDEGKNKAAIIQLVELAAVILSTVDRTVSSTGTVLRTPNLESLGPDGKRIFPGSDPESVQDPTLRAAYKNLIKKNEDLLVRVGIEKEKTAASEYALKAATRIIESANDPNDLLKSVQMQIEAMSAAQWIKEKLLRALIPNYVENSSSAIPSVPKATQNLPEPIAQGPNEQSSPKAISQSLITEQAPAVPVTNSESGVALESRRIWPWIVIAAVLLSSVWVMFKRRQ